jgi:hypothetical protein
MTKKIRIVKQINVLLFEVSFFCLRLSKNFGPPLNLNTTKAPPLKVILPQ